MSNVMRINGFSGFDVDSTVKQLMKAENTKVDKVKQQRQILQWQQDMYREIVGNLNTFKSTYFDVLKSDTYMLSAKSYSSYSVKSSDTNNKITATASTGAAAGNYSITVNQVAKAASITGNAINVEQATSGVTFPIRLDGTNNTFEVANESGSYDIALTANQTFNNLSDLASALNSKMTTIDADGGKKLSDRLQARVSSDGSGIEFVKKVEISDANNNKQITLSMGTSGAEGTFTIDLSAGNYTTDEIAAQINSKLSGLSGFPSGVRAQSTDGQNITFINSDNTSHIGTASISSSLPTVNGNGGISPTGGTGTPPTSSQLTFTSNKVTYEKQIIKDINDALTFNISGTNVSITLDFTNVGAYSGMTDTQIASDLASKINTKLTSKSVDSNTIQASVSADGRLQFIGKDGKQISVSGSATRTLGFSSSFEINQSTNDSINNLMGNNIVKFTINGVEFNYDFSKTSSESATGVKGRTISSILSDISSKANININYSELTRSFSMSSSSTGSAQAITASDSAGSFLATIFGSGNYNTATGANGTTIIAGQDANVTITAPGSLTGTTVSKPNNSFTIDGVAYSIDPSIDLTVAANKTATLTVSKNPDATFDKIVLFIGKYNDMIDSLNKKIDEKRLYSYNPLTDDEKTSLKDSGQEDQITVLEGKAKQGLLKNDLTISNMLTSIRHAFYDTVKDSGITLSEIGLSTSPDTSQRGKIIIDEEKLKSALVNNGDKVAKLFTQQSSSYPYYSADMKSSDRSKRYEEEGIFQRINDILQDNVRMTRDNSGNKGTLIQKAGIAGDITETLGILPKLIKDKDDQITSLLAKLSDKEDRYYKQFTAMESALTQLNSQSSWLASQLGTSSS